MIGQSKKTRRQFLIGTGGTVLAIPFLSSLYPETAHAAGTAKRFVALISKLGQRHEYWKPFQAATGPNGLRQLPLSAFNTTGINQILTAKFAPYHSKMSFFRGLDGSVQFGHNSGEYALGAYTGVANWPTIDQVFANSNMIYGPMKPAVSSLLLRNSSVGSNVNANLNGMSSLKFQNGILARPPAIHDPTAALDRIFAVSNPANKTRNVKVVDRVLASFVQLQEHKNISPEDKKILQNYIDGFNDLENRIANTQSLACARPALPSVNTVSSDEPLLKTYSQLLNDIIVLALQCDATRVVNYLLGRTEYSLESVQHGWSHILEEETGQSDLRERHKLANRWIAESLVLDLVAKMDRVSESNGKTLLDNSLVLWGNELSCGSSHNQYNMPAVLFGSAGGAIQTGKFFDYTRYGVGPILNVGTDQYAGRLYNQLVVTMLQSMGLRPSNYEMNGQKGYGVYFSANGNRRQYYAAVEGDHHLPLPGVLVGA